LVDGVSKVEVSTVFNNSTPKVIEDAFKHTHPVSITVYYTQMMKQQMKPTQMHDIYLIKHLLGTTINWLVKDSEAWGRLYDW
jgi:hypothetical protein